MINVVSGCTMNLKFEETKDIGTPIVAQTKPKLQNNNDYLLYARSTSSKETCIGHRFL